MRDDYDPADNSAKSYELAIRTMRDKLASFRREQIGECTLYLGDCREILPLLPKVDITVTSPPYNTLPTNPNGSGRYRGDGWIAKAATGYFDNRPESEYQKWLNDVISACRRACKGLVWINHKVRYRDGEAVHPARMIDGPIYSEVIWDRPGSMTFNSRRFAPSHEGFWAIGKPHYWDDTKNKLLTVWRVPFVQGSEHPCPYPIDLIAPIIEASCPHGGTVLDPFAGSGTTGVACVKLGRRFIGIEIELKYFDIACRRIEEAYKQPDMFVAQPPKAEQLTLEAMA